MSLLHGVRCFRQGFTLAWSPAARRFVLIPLLISLAVCTVGLVLAFSRVEALSLFVHALLPDWLAFVEFIVAPLLYALTFLLGAWSFGLIATVISAPFLGDLCLHIERLKEDPAPAWRRFVSGLRREMRKLRYHLPRLAVLALLGLIPLVNSLAPLFWLGFGAWMMAVQFCDYSSENRQLPFGATLTLLSQHRGAALGFGACVSVALAIPLINVLIPPAAAAGATLLSQSLRGIRP